MKTDSTAGDLTYLEDALFDFFGRKYVLRADERQKAMGLSYLEAERRDLAHETARFIFTLADQTREKDDKSTDGHPKIGEKVDLKLYSDVWVPGIVINKFEAELDTPLRCMRNTVAGLAEDRWRLRKPVPPTEVCRQIVATYLFAGRRRDRLTIAKEIVTELGAAKASELGPENVGRLVAMLDERDAAAA